MKRLLTLDGVARILRDDSYLVIRFGSSPFCKPTIEILGYAWASGLIVFCQNAFYQRRFVIFEVSLAERLWGFSWRTLSLEWPQLPSHDVTHHIHTQWLSHCSPFVVVFVYQNSAIGYFNIVDWWLLLQLSVSIGFVQRRSLCVHFMTAARFISASKPLLQSSNFG